jgi:hypothetical protein
MNRLLRDIGYFLILALMVIGITGVIYHAIGEQGWIAGFLGDLIDHSISAIVLIALGVLLVVWLARRWLIATQANALFNDFLMYAMVALGLFFLGRLVLYGSF